MLPIFMVSESFRVNALMSQPTTSSYCLDCFEGDRFDDVSTDKPWEVVDVFSTPTYLPETDNVTAPDATGGAA